MNDLYRHDGEPRVSDGNHMTARECEVHAIEWGMVKVEPDYEAAYDLLQNKQYVSWNAVEEAVDAALKEDTSPDVEGCQQCGHYQLDHEELGGPCSWGMGRDGVIWCRCIGYVAALTQEDTP